MLPPIPTEASYAQWLVNCIQSYFEGIGFSFYPEVQSQPREKDYPFDIYAGISKGNVIKRFGLQVKRPHTSKQGNITITIVCTAISIGITQGISYYKD